MAGLLRGAIEKREMPFGTLERFSKWCDTGGKYVPSMKIAKRISMALFGIVNPRLLDKSDHRVNDYDDLRAQLQARFQPPTPSPDQDVLDPTPDTEETGPAARRPGTRDQLVRDTAVTLEVKRLHDFHCQVCGIRLEVQDCSSAEGTHIRPYAEGAHIHPLGRNGPDRRDNVLCLCPNHHVLFDKGAFSITDDMDFLIRDGLTRDNLGLVGKCRTVREHTTGPEYLRYHREHVFCRGS